MSNGPSMRASAESAAERMNLLLSLSCFCTACCTLGVLKRASTWMMCSRATGSLPSIRATKIVDRGFIGDFGDDLEQAALFRWAPGRRRRSAVRAP